MFPWSTALTANNEIYWILRIIRMLNKCEVHAYHTSEAKINQRFGLFWCVCATVYLCCSLNFFQDHWIFMHNFGNAIGLELLQLTLHILLVLFIVAIITSTSLQIRNEIGFSQTVKKYQLFADILADEWIFTESSC